MAKVLYSFTIKKITEVEEEKQEIVKNDNGEDVTRTYKEKIKKEVPVEIIINQPNRKQMQEADMEFSVEMSRCIRNGVLTKAMLLNKYNDTGGLISEADAKTMVNSADDIRELQAKLSILNLKPESERDEEDKLKIDTITSQILQRRKTLIEKETSYLTLFNHTADIKAQNRAILWYVLHLSYYKDSSKKNVELEPLFPGKTFEQKEATMFDHEENKHEIYEKCYSKLASIISYWFFTSNQDKDEFDRIVGEIDGTIPTE
jgi:hypothetical protein